MALTELPVLRWLNDAPNSTVTHSTPTNVVVRVEVSVVQVSAGPLAGRRIADLRHYTCIDSPSITTVKSDGASRQAEFQAENDGHFI